jgi:hypothetical protein
MEEPMFLYTNQSKKGLSLITVLLFMLVATLAATGVFKWLSTQNKASASRLMQSEVYQASQAGIETARSWMTYNASDVGALIKQYKDGNRKPILLDSVLYPLVSDKNQKFSVLLVGADTKSYPYKLKLISTGTARNGSKYSQVAILSVSGLYQVEVPEIKKSIDFNYAFWGASLYYDGSNTVSSVVLNGNWDHNPPTTTGDFIVTGNVSLSGNKINVGENTCIGGNLTTNNGFLGKNDLYVAGTTYAFNGTVEGNAYFDGNVNFGNTSVDAFTVNGNVTLNGKMITNQNSFNHLINGNLCLGNTGSIEFNGTNNAFKVADSIWIPSNNALTGGTDLTKASQQFLGSKTTSTMNISNVTLNNVSAGITRYKHNTSNTYFITKSGSQSTSATGTPSFSCAESAKNYCDNIWSKKTGCNGLQYVVEDKIITAYNTFKEKAVTTSTCSNLKTNFSNGDQMVNSLNDCYKDLHDNQPDLLYNDFLVVKLTSSGLSGFSALLKGKFVFILENDLGQQKIPGMTADSYVLMYLLEGARGDMVEPAKCDGSAVYNYFIYSLKQVKKLNNFTSNCPITGTIYLPETYPEEHPNAGTSSCLEKTNLSGTTQLEFNPDLLEVLSTANILCPNDGTACGNPTGTPGSSSSSITSNGLDAYFIAVAPRLNTSLETQYVNKEIDIETLTSSSYNLLEPSILVMPRTIYLPKNAKGTLKQYFSVLNLNGASENINLGSVSCPTGLNASGALSGSTAGVYTCTYSPGNSNYNSSHFFVVVDGLLEQGAKVSLSLSDAAVVSFDPDFTAGESHEIYAHISGGSEKEVKFGLKLSDPIPSGWTLTPAGASGEITEIAPQVNVYYFTIKPGAKKIKLFGVSTQTSATGAVVFELVTPFEGVEFVSKTVSLSLNGTATVQRKSLSDIPEENKTDSIKKWIDYPACPDSSNAWVYAKPDCNELNPNKSWECALYGSPIELGWYFVDGCTVFEPQNNRIENSKDSTYTLYADLKRTPYTVYVKTEGGSANIHVSDTLGLVDEQDFGVIPGNTQPVMVFHGVKYDIKASAVNTEDHFNYWKCKTASGADCALPSFPGSTYRYTPSTNNDTLIIYFNQKNNCFTETFEGLQENCSLSEPERCIDDCISGKSCSVNGGAYTNTADWIMIDANGNKKDIEIEDGSDAYAWNGKNGNQVFILKPIVAGYEGVYTAQIRAYPKNSIMSNQSLNTGLVFRSNATGTSYFTLSVLSKKKDNTDLLRVCYATQAHISNEGQCITKGDALSTWTGSNLDQVETYTVKATLLGDSLYVTVLDSKGEIYIPETVFNLKDSKFNASGVSASQNEYVGFKLYGDHFRLYSMTWDSKTYLCFEKPQFYCSFKANYAGGRIPSKTDVTPWAFVSNFCNENEACCDYTYYPSAPMQFDAGNYPEDHVKASASCVRDGETKVFDTIPCGAFTVGDRIPCVEDIMIATSSGYCSGYGNCEVSLDKISNLRDAVLNFDLTLNGGADTISVYLVDEKGIESQAGGYMIEDKNYHFPVRNFIDVDQFNSERISKVLFKSAKGLSFEVKNIFTTCPNSLKLGSCVITYNGSKLIFTGNASNAQNCIISGSYGFSETISCEGSWTFTKEIDLSSYAGETLTWDITAKNFQDPSITETCSGSVDIKAPSGTCSWSLSTLTATTTGTAQFTAIFTDCPTSGCAYEIKNHQGIQVAFGTGTPGTANFTTPKAVGSYTYSAHVNGKKLCEASLNVVAGSPATASCGGVASDGKFTASVTDTDKVGWTWKVVVTDYLGNVLHTSPVSGAQTGNGNIAFTGYNPSVAGSYTYSLFLNGSLTSECNSSLTIVGSITNCSLTPTTINPGDYVSFTATTDKIANGTACTIKHSGGTEYTSGSPTVNSNQCSSAFYPTQAGVYSVYIGEYDKSCGTVTINGGTSCEYQSSWCNGIDFSNVLILPSGTYDNNCSGVSCPPGATDWNANKCFFIKSPCSVYQNVSSTHAGDGGCYAYRSGSNWWKVNGGTGGNPSCGGTITPSSSSVVASSSSVTPASSSGGSITIANNQWNFTVASGTSVCFTNHPVVYDWQSSANILCNACGYSGCTVSFGTVSGSDWNAAQLNIPLNASKTFSGCWVASRTDNANVVCTILAY